MQSIRNYIDKFVVSKRIVDFCSGICSYTPLKHSESFEEVTCFGREHSCSATAYEIAAFRDANVLIPNDNRLTYYDRVVRDKIVFYSKVYKRAKKFNNSCVQLENQNYAIAQKILRLPNQSELWTLITPIRLSRNSHISPNIKTCAFDYQSSVELIPFKKVMRKCILINLSNDNFICDVPNFYERN